VRGIKRIIFFFVAFGLSLILSGVWNSAEGAPGSPKIHLKLAGGLSFLSDGGGDLESIRLSSQEPDDFPIERTFDWEGISSIADWKAEVLLTFGRHFGAGFGVGRTSMSSTGDFFRRYYYYGFEWTEFLFDEKNSFHQQFQVSALALQLNAYAFLPLGRFKAYVFGGPGLYFGSFSHEFDCDLSWYVYERGFAPDWESIDDKMKHLEISETAQDRALGFQGGLGLEFQVWPQISVGFEASIRRVNFKNWDGTSTTSYQALDKSFDTASGWSTEQESWTHTGEGPLWFCYLELPHSVHIPTLFIGEDPPEDYYTNPTRQAAIDFNAVDLLLTLRIHI
jgi:opacity protein-like surface antigen